MRDGTRFPAWTHTVGAMKDARDEKPEDCCVKVTCDTCKGDQDHRDVDLDAIIAKRGRQYSLINRRFRCRFTRGCFGHNRFHYQSGVMRPLWTPEQGDKWFNQDFERQQMRDAEYARKARAEQAKMTLAKMIHGREIRLDPPPEGIDWMLWAICNDTEREVLLKRAGINPVDARRRRR